MGVERRLAVYECSTIRIASEISLSAPLSADKNATTADVVFEMGQRQDQPHQRPSTDVIAELSIEGRPFYAFCKVEDGYVGRIPSIADFHIAEDLKRVVCHPVIDGRDELIPIVIPGTVTAFLLAMSGRCVLHASAVDLGDRALAFVGTSGQGKSTMAAVFCAAGAPLVTDDVLPLEFDQRPESTTPVYCRQAGTEIRLREKSSSLADQFLGKASVRTTADDRRAVEPKATPLDRIPLAAIVLPRPDRDIYAVQSTLLGPGEAALWLSRCLRVEGWHRREHIRQQFIDTGYIVAAVPVFEVRVPWGPPFRSNLAPAILDACGLDAVAGD